MKLKNALCSLLYIGDPVDVRARIMAEIRSALFVAYRSRIILRGWRRFRPESHKNIAGLAFSMRLLSFHNF
jgi:hypothetical protein